MGNLLPSMKFPDQIVIHGYSPACMLRVGGPDAATFLQGQFTNDLGNLAPGEAAYGLWLDRRGHVIADSHVILDPGGEGFWIVSVTSPAASVAGHLEAHIIADDVAVADETASWRGIALVGDGAGAWLAAGTRPGIVFAGRRHAGESWEWLLPSVDRVPAEIAGARMADAAEMERMRIAAAIPSVPADIGPADLPNEGGLEAVAISYSKGCYTGQEVMARLKSRGRVRRQLVRVRGAGSPPGLPAALWQGERREGELRTAVAQAGGYAGLALVPAAVAGAGGRFATSQGAEPTVEIDRGA
jgi:folate-binding protein YgfZ